jgi:hypothetical protein
VNYNVMTPKNNIRRGNAGIVAQINATSPLGTV